MTTPINKLLTSHKQTLSNSALANVSASLSAILGQGGGTYTGDGQYIDVENNTITLTQTAASLLNSVEYKLDTDIYAAASATWEDVANTYKTYSADYALKSELPDVTDMATQTWVGQQGYLTSIPDSYATKTYANDASANALSEAKTWVGDQGFLKSTDLTDYATKTYVDTASAEALSQAKTWVEEQSYLPTSGGTVSGKLTVNGSDFDNSLEIIRGGSDTSASTGQIGINGAGGLSFKIKRGNNNTQLNIAPNATMDKRFSVGDSPYSPAAYLIPAVTATTTAGLADDGILHIIVEN